MAKTAPFAKLAAGVAVGAASAALAYRLVALRTPQSDELVTYPPVDTLKPVTDAVWVVDGGPIGAAGLKLPIRMTVVRLSSGDLFLHSPTRFTPDFARAIEALGRVRHLVAPTTAHWTFLKEWQRAFPDATTWAVPGLRDRAQVRRAGVRIDRDLGPEAPADWAGEMRQGMIAGGAGFREAWFFEEVSRTLLLTGLIENLEPGKLPPMARALFTAAGATRATTAYHVRAVLRLGGRATMESIAAMVALAPERVIFAHGRWFEEGGSERLRDAFAWITP